MKQLSRASILFFIFVSLSFGVESVTFQRDFAPMESWTKDPEKPFRDELCLNGCWQFQPVPLPGDWKRNAGNPPELPPPAADSWERTPIKIPSPWNVNTWGGGRDAGMKPHNKYWPDSVYYPSYPESWDRTEMGWLRRTFKIPGEWKSKDKRIFLHFEAVAGNCIVLVNGRKAGEHFDKFLPFELDVTELLKLDGENELLVGVRSHILFDKQSEKYPKMRATYPPGSEIHRLVGITEDVLLLTRSETNVADVFVKPMVGEDTLELEIATSAEKPVANVEVEVVVSPWINRAGRDILDAPEPRSEIGAPLLTFQADKRNLLPGHHSFFLRHKINGALKHWTPETPELYVVDVRLKIDGTVVDCKQTRFGWREFRISGGDLLLNGNKIQLFGDLLHPFGPYIYSRRFVRSWYTMIKDMGGNAVRPHAQIHPRAFLEMADEMGVVVLAENAIFGSSVMLNFEEPMTWERYAEHTKGMVLRDRNHPSVVGWSIGNELFAIFDLNNISPKDSKKYYDKIVDLGKLCSELDPTRNWISCDGDEDLQERISVWSKHFGHGIHTDRLPRIEKPLMVGESGGTYYATPKQLSVFNGVRSYESYAGRNEALGIDVYDNIVKMARPRLAFFSASETAWFGLEHLPLGYNDFSRRPTLDDGIFFTQPFEEGKRGMQPERLPPYVTTFNPGWDPDLPLYRPLEMFHAEKAAIRGLPYEPKTEKPPIPEAVKPTPVFDKVRFFGKSNSPLKKRLDASGLPFSETGRFLIVDADSLDQAELENTKRTIGKNLESGNSVLVFAQKKETDLEAILGLRIETTRREATMLVPNHKHPWTARLPLSELYFAEDGDGRFIQKAGLDGEGIEGFETIFEGSDTDWSLFNRVPEHSKCGAILICERLLKPSGKALIAKEKAGGTIAVCSLDYAVETKSSRTFWRRLFENMGVVLNEESTLLLPAISDENSLVNTVALGRLTDEEAAEAIDTALKTPPCDKDVWKGKTWKTFKSPSKDRIVFNWIDQNGDHEPFNQLLSFWIKSPRALDDLLADGPDAPKFGILNYVADECEFFLNGVKMTPERMEAVDYRTLYHWNGLPLKKDWNHLLIRVKSKNWETERPGTLAVRLHSNIPSFLNEFDSAAELPREEKRASVRSARVNPPKNAVDPETLHGKLVCGYQGWFHAEGDGSGCGWVHYSGKSRRFEPGVCSVDLWPDMSEMDEDEKYPTAFKHADGSTAYVFSSQNRKTVLRHFSWMEQYGIDGVFLQRFLTNIRDENQREFRQNVMEHVRDGAEKHGRTWAVMYDLSGAGEGELLARITDDWKRIVDENRICDDTMYQHHAGKPVVAVWGIGFADHRKYTLRECLDLILFLKNDPKYGNNTVMLGVPSYWRELCRDALKDELLHEIVRKADIVSPWTVGRYGGFEQLTGYLEVAAADKEWCRKEGKDYLPVVFPGFSWQNLSKNHGIEAPLNAIPRLKGEFLTRQIKGHLDQGTTMIYQAMFDEIDEATAVFKCTNAPPIGESRFITYEDLASDYYLKLLGKASLALKRKSVKSTPR